MRSLSTKIPLSQRLLQRRGVHSPPEVRACKAPVPWGGPSTAPRSVDFADLPGTVEDAHLNLRSRQLQESSQTSESARRVCDKRARRRAQRRLSAQVSRTPRRRAKHQATPARIRSPWTQLQSRAREAGRSRTRNSHGQQLPRLGRSLLDFSKGKELEGRRASFSKVRALSGPIFCSCPSLPETRQQLPAPEKPTHDRDVP